MQHAIEGSRKNHDPCRQNRPVGCPAALGFGAVGVFGPFAFSSQETTSIGDSAACSKLTPDARLFGLKGISVVANCRCRLECGGRSPGLMIQTLLQSDAALWRARRAVLGHEVCNLQSKALGKI